MPELMMIVPMPQPMPREMFPLTVDETDTQSSIQLYHDLNPSAKTRPPQQSSFLDRLCHVATATPCKVDVNRGHIHNDNPKQARLQSHHSPVASTDVRHHRLHPNKSRKLSGTLTISYVSSFGTAFLRTM